MRLLKSVLLVSFTLIASLYLIRDAEAQKMSLPAVGGWNGFLDQQNVVECSNAGNSADIRLTVKDPTGATLGVVGLTLASQSTQHIPLNSFPIANKYGTYSLELTGGDGTKLSCITVFYRSSKPGAREPFEYIFAIPVEDASRGEVAGVFNSFDALGGTKPVYNWLSIVNQSNKDFSGYVHVYNLDGSIDTSRTIRVLGLKPQARQDFALGHDRGLTIGLYRVVPDDASQLFTSFITRYGQADAAGTYAYAFPLRAQKPTCNLEPIHASTMADAFNWGEIANPTNQPVTVKATIFSRFGEKIGTEKQVTIPPFSQSHIPLHEYLGPNNVGTLHVECVGTGQGGVLAQSVFYGRSTASRTQLEWVYASQSRPKNAYYQATALTHVNTFLGAWNWSKTLSSANQVLNSEFRTYAANGEMVGQQAAALAADGTWDYGVHEAAGANFVGMGLQPLSGSPGTLTGEVLRVIPANNGSVGYIFNIPDRILGESIAPELVDSDADGMTDVWERANGLDPYSSADAALDRDGDRLSNLEEFRRGLNPSLADSNFSGNPNSLAPYISQLTAEEVRLLGKKFAMNDDRLMTYDIARTDRQAMVNLILGDDFFSADLRDQLVKLRDNPKNLTHRTWDNQPIVPLIRKNNPFQTTAEIREGLDTMTDYMALAYNTLTLTLLHEPYTSPNYLYFGARYGSPMRTLMAHLWAGHFGIDMSGFGGPMHMWQKMWIKDTLLGKGMGSFRDMIVGNAANQGCSATNGGVGPGMEGADGVICQFAALNLLNNDLNRVNAPNENFAREFMELFTTSPYDRWTGTPNYSQDTVRAATAFFSGYGVNWWKYPNYGTYFEYYDPARHDTRSYTAFPGTSYQVSGTMTPGQFADHVVTKHPATPRFIAGKLFSMLIYPNPPEALVAEAANKFKNEFNWDIKKLLNYYMNSEAMFSAKARQRNYVIEPFKMYMKIARGFQLPLITTAEPTRDVVLHSRYLLGEWHSAIANSGENVMNFPDVFAYDYGGRYPNSQIDGSTEWLDASRLLGRFRGLTLLTQRTWDYTGGGDSPLLRLKNVIPKTGAGNKHTPDDLIRYYQKLFDVELAPNEYTLIRNYLISSNATSAPNESVWNPTNDYFLRSKLYGLLLIFSGTPQGNLE